jgi:four helix bundle protein
MTEFKTLMVWQKGMELVKSVYELSYILPDNERYGIRSQITRAAISIPSNIAEGCSRSSKKDFKRFLEISLGSCFELETQIISIQMLNLTNNNQINLIMNNIIEEQKMLHGFIKRLST